MEQSEKLIVQVNRLEREKTDHYQAVRELQAELKAVRSAAALPREKLRAALFAIGEVIAGRPVENIAWMRDDYRLPACQRNHF